jgi:hypothetical protein
MSVTHVIPGGLSESRRVKSQAVSTPLRFGARRRPVLAVTSDRTRRVGRPTVTVRRADADVDPLVAEAAATGIESLGLLEQRAFEAALDFRWNRVVSGRRGLGDLVNGIQSIVTLAVSAAEATGVDLECLCAIDGRGASEATRRAVTGLIADQQSEDWNGLANTIEQRFIPALDCWRAVFDALTGANDDFDPSGFAA